MKFGMNLLLWSGRLDEPLWPTVEMLKQIGYDGVELPVFELDVPTYARWGKRLDDLGLERTAVTVRGEEDNPISADAAVRARGVDATKQALDCCQPPACSQLVGPYPFGPGPLLRCGSDAGRMEMGRREHAAKSPNTPARSGVTLGVECLNRFETLSAQHARRLGPIRARSQSSRTAA